MGWHTRCRCAARIQQSPAIVMCTSLPSSATQHSGCKSVRAGERVLLARHALQPAQVRRAIAACSRVQELEQAQHEAAAAAASRDAAHTELNKARVRVATLEDAAAVSAATKQSAEQEQASVRARVASLEEQNEALQGRCGHLLEDARKVRQGGLARCIIVAPSRLQPVGAIVADGSWLMRLAVQGVGLASCDVCGCIACRLRRAQRKRTCNLRQR
jgi:type IV secretory pathway VirB10-like protein